MTARILLVPVLVSITLAGRLVGQELQPRAYLPAPVGLSFFSVSYSNNSGGLLFDPSLPITGSQVNANSGQLAFGQWLGFLGRSSQAFVVLPYLLADLSGTFAGSQQSRHRSGLADSTYRFSTNLYGAPAMHVEEFARYRPKTIIGASLTATAPTGQYDPNRLVNIGTNRWALKPELGISHFVGKWDFEGAFGVWLYVRNADFYGNTVRTQDPLGSIQAHVVRLLPHRTWAALDGTFYLGGRTYTDGVAAANYTSNTRFGATFGFAIAQRQALKFSYFRGATTRVGTDVRSLSISYQVLWNSWR